MSLIRHWWNALNDLADVVWTLEGNAIANITIKDFASSQPIPSSASKAESENASPPGREHSARAAPTKPDHPDSVEQSQEKDNKAQELKKKGFKIVSNSLNAVSPELNLYCINHDHTKLVQQLQLKNVRHLKWQNEATMTIKKLKKYKRVWKLKARATKRASVRAKAAMRRHIGDLERQVQSSQLEKLRSIDEHAQAIETLKNSLQESREELQTQKETFEQAMAAAESRIAEAKTKHEEEISTARSKIEKLTSRLTPSYTSAYQRKAGELREELAQVEKQRVKEIAAKDEEIKTIQKSVIDYNFRIHHLNGVAETARQAQEEAEKGRNEHYRTKLKAESEARKLRAENESLKLELKAEKESLKLEKEDGISRVSEAESRVTGANGRAKGLQDQLKAINNRVLEWEKWYEKTQEDARDRTLSAYEFDAVQNLKKKQQRQKAFSEDEGSSELVKKLSNEKAELQTEIDSLNAKLNEAGEAATKSQNAREGNSRCSCGKDRQGAPAEARSNDAATDGRDAKEQEIRLQYEVEKKEALAEERENIRVKWESWECSLREHFALKLKSHTSQELQKVRRRAGIEHKIKSKVKRSQVKSVFKRAVSCGVEVERALIQKNLYDQYETQLSKYRNDCESEQILMKKKIRSQFQKQLSNYKAEFEAEHAKAPGPSATQKDAETPDKALLDQEIKKRDSFIDQLKQRLKDAYTAKHEADGTLKNIKEENERLSRRVIAYENQESMNRQTRSEAQITLMAQDLARALNLLAETAIMGLDQKHHHLFNELVLANKIVRDLRSKIEQGEKLDYEDVQQDLDRIYDDSDGFESLDPSERPALHSQLRETYLVVGGLINILKKGERGDNTSQDILERIYGIHCKGEGKQDSNFGPTNVAPGPMSGAPSTTSSFQPNGPNTPTASPHLTFQQSGFRNNTPLPTTAPIPYPQPLPTTPQPNVAPQSQPDDGPESLDCATAHARLGTDEMDPSGQLDGIDLDAIDWDDPVWKDFGVGAAAAAF